MTTATTFLTATGTTWVLIGVTLARLGADGLTEGERYAAVPNALNRSGRPWVTVQVGCTVTFVDRGEVKTTGRIANVVKVASVKGPAASSAA